MYKSHRDRISKKKETQKTRSTTIENMCKFILKNIAIRIRGSIFCGIDQIQQESDTYEGQEFCKTIFK